MMERNRPDRLSGKRGSIIVLVLVFIVLMGFIVVAFMQEATAKVKYYGLFHNRDDLRTDAYSAMEITLAVINQYREVEGALWGPAQGWSNPLAEVEFEPAHATSVKVEFDDESAKLPLSGMEYDQLLMLFDVLGFDLPDAEALADGLLDWTDEDDDRRLNGFDGDDYDDMDPPYKPSNSAITTWDEFKLIDAFKQRFWNEDGLPTAEWSRFKSAVSLYHGGAVNLNQASGLVLDYLYEKQLIDPDRLDFYMNGADGISGTEDDRLWRKDSTFEDLLLAESSEVTDQIELLLVKVTAFRGEARFTLEALVSWSGSNPGVAGASRTGQSANEANRDLVNNNPQSAEQERERATGSARTTESTASELGYPFTFLRISENRKI